MKAVILAGGQGTRMGSLTKSLPKPLLKVCGKELIRHVLDALPDVIRECVVVLGYQGYKIRSFLGQNHKGRMVHYVEQVYAGTGGALLSAVPLLMRESRFMVVGADDIFGYNELIKLLSDETTYGITYGLPHNRGSTGVLFTTDGRLLGRELVDDNKPRYFGVGAYVLPNAVFHQPFAHLDSGEYSIPHSLHTLSFPVYVRHITNWLPINTPQELEYAEHNLRKDF